MHKTFTRRPAPRRPLPRRTTRSDASDAHLTIRHHRLRTGNLNPHASGPAPHAGRSQQSRSRPSRKQTTCDADHNAVSWAGERTKQPAHRNAISRAASETRKPRNGSRPQVRPRPSPPGGGAAGRRAGLRAKQKPQITASEFWGFHRAAFGIRTRDLRITSALLWPSELRRRAVHTMVRSATSVSLHSFRGCSEQAPEALPPRPVTSHYVQRLPFAGGVPWSR